MRLAALTGGDGGDGTGDDGKTDGDRTTNCHVAANVLYIVKKFRFNSGDVRSAPTLHRDGMWLAVLTGAYGGHIAVDGSDSNGDRTTSCYVAENVPYIGKNYHYNSGDVEYSPSVDRDRYLARTADGGSGR
jgi:hypothetical protein